jgi:hypothetical protein
VAAKTLIAIFLLFSFVSGALVFDDPGIAGDSLFYQETRAPNCSTEQTDMASAMTQQRGLRFRPLRPKTTKLLPQFSAKMEPLSPAAWIQGALFSLPPAKQDLHRLNGVYRI